MHPVDSTIDKQVLIEYILEAVEGAVQLLDDHAYDLSDLMDDDLCSRKRAFANQRI